jgi:hypothetical protein
MDPCVDEKAASRLAEKLESVKPEPLPRSISFVAG